ncbi:vitellogenin-6-like protein, partial [Leptotrombidium deliense]
KGFNEKFAPKKSSFCFVNVDSLMGKDCFLAFSSIISLHCEKQTETEVCSKYISDILNKAKQSLNSNANIERLMLTVKSIKNLAFNSGFQILHSVYSNKQNPLILRIEAVWAVASIQMNGNRTMATKLIQLINDEHEEHEIRVAAFYSLFATGATIEELRTVLLNLREKDKKLNSYIYSQRQLLHYISRVSV